MVSQFRPSTLQLAIYGGHLLRHIQCAVNRHELDLLSPSIQRFITSTQKYDELHLLRQKIITVLNHTMKNHG